MSSDNRTYTREWKSEEKTGSFTSHVRLQDAYLSHPKNLAVINIKQTEKCSFQIFRRPWGSRRSRTKWGKVPSWRLCSLGALAGVEAKLGWPDCPNLNEAAAAKARKGFSATDWRCNRGYASRTTERELEVEDNNELRRITSS